jgi:hypothetical protein
MASNPQHERRTVGRALDRPSYTTWSAHPPTALSKSQPLSRNPRPLTQKFTWNQSHGHVQASTYSLRLFPQNLATSSAIRLTSQRVHWGEDLHSETLGGLPRSRHLSHTTRGIGLDRGTLCGTGIHIAAFVDRGTQIWLSGLCIAMRSQSPASLYIRIGAGSLRYWTIRAPK